ncbi:MAG TPA: NUDIX domain-containing protein [Gemmatimonadaceae bacterium]|nr:NUDIX domain-containing protein [Gemmatimonadaceae bacterium]
MAAQVRGRGEVKLPVREQISAGGVVFRAEGDRIDVVIVAVGGNNRWQLPKGLVEKDEDPKIAAVREAREEGGTESEVVEHIETVEYWFAGLDKGERVRFHKRVHFYLLRYLSGDTANHDWEVNEARWVPIDEAVSQLAFDNERRVVEQAKQLITDRDARKHLQTEAGSSEPTSL